MPRTGSRGPGRPPAAKAAETRRRILHAAREVFSERGYEAATFQAIAVRADLTRPAINHYFANKRVLYLEVLEQTSDLLAASIRRAERETTLPRRLSTFIAATTDTDAQDRSAAAFLITSVLESRRHPELRAVETDLLRSTRAFLNRVLDDAIRRGEVATEADSASLTEMLVALLCGVVFYAGYVGQGEELDAVTRQLERLMDGRLWQVES
ncbi:MULTISPECIES: TetR/AcrR family transcriptional regulator [Mycobacterium]|uniref:TetR/AcrR family transcriptional regulator n=1 Tax=Mycobacterium TaxID=1763 RepID=UPI000C18155D|nr:MULTISPECIES: TetR/AcrR family transcriptional regulator [Mycobacterium]MDA3640411.1 TetR/AcrR family transcriptional regulator [Mycobacterium xenopi]MDA3656570.1 TetR/AcrR family transcriptional regulator [Mycobacterium xenopi]MDA3661165.1 TetR/AcrR family transcriptional regulator [Mycobacterium xenopi]